MFLSTAMAVAASQAHADGGPEFYVSGFGTAGLASSDTKDAEFVQNSQAAGTKSGVWRTGVDSNFGIQSTAVFNDTVSATAQGLVRKFATDAYTASLSWAFIKVRATDELSLRVGRMGVPVYLITDYRYIGYSNTMIRPPVELYSQVNFDHLDGADATYKHSFDATTLTVQFGLGTNTTDIVGGPQGRFTDLTSLNVVLENGPLTLRLGRIDTKATALNFPAFAQFAATLAAAGFPDQGKSFLVDHAKASFTSLGLIYSTDKVVGQAEYAVRRSATLSIAATTSWYAMAGYKFGKLTPYYVHSTVKQDKNRQVAGLPTTGPLAPLTAVANAIASAPLQTTNSLGLKWDFRDSMNLKVQIDHVAPRDGAGLFINSSPGFKGPVNVYAAAINFVF